VEVVEYATRTKKQKDRAVVQEHLTIPSIPMNYQHFHQHVFHAKRYSHYSQKSKPDFMAIFHCSAWCDQTV